MNKNIKKILIIGVPILVAMIIIATIFTANYNVMKGIYTSTMTGEYMSYEVKSLSSTTTPDHTVDNPNYQLKSTINLRNRCNHALDTFDIKITFVDDNGYSWEYIHEDFKFTNTTQELLISQIFDKDAKAIDQVEITFDEIYSTITLDKDYENTYGKNNTIISDNTLTANRVVTLAFWLFSIIVASAVSALVIMYSTVNLKKSPKKNINKKKKV